MSFLSKIQTGKQINKANKVCKIMNFSWITRNAHEKQNFCLSPSRWCTGITMSLILVTTFRIQTASCPLQMASTVPIASDCCLCTCALSENKCGAFFPSVNSKNSDTGKMINLFWVQRTVIYSILHFQVKIFFPFRRLLETDGCS